MDVSIIIATYNRRDVVLATLHRLLTLRGEVTANDSHRCEIIVVDNASTDGTADAVSQRFPMVRLIRLNENRGSCAKAFGTDVARGRFILFLDDDSFPRPGSISRMIEMLDAQPELAAVGFRVHLPDGREESGALPGVFVGCGVGLRRDALKQVNGLDRDMFMQAEEYDLCFRLASAGWQVICADHLHVDHLKTSQSRSSPRTASYDTQNNLLIAARYVPDRWLNVIMRDLHQRYAWLYDDADCRERVRQALHISRKFRRTERARCAGIRLTDHAFERFFCYARIAREMMQLAGDGVSRILLADLGKNIYPFVRGARLSGIEITAIADDRFARPHRRYRGIPVMPSATARQLPHDAVIVSNTSWFHARQTTARWCEFSHTVHCCFDSLTQSALVAQAAATG